MYSFAQRDDTIVIDEPLYGHYLRITGAGHPGREEILSAMECDGQKVIDNVMLAEYPAEVLFIKNMTHHLVEIDTAFMGSMSNVFLIRDPARIISSFHQVISSVTMTDIGVKKQYDLFEQLSSAGFLPLVIDSGEILRSPEAALTKLCLNLGIEFQKKMLSWSPGPRPEDGVWAKHWYANVHASAGFENQTSSLRELPEHLKDLYEECRPYYLELSKHSIKV